MFVRGRIPMRGPPEKDTSPDRNTVGEKSSTDAECEDEKLQECYYRHELPKAGCVFQPVGNVPLRFAACFLLLKPVPFSTSKYDMKSHRGART